MKRLAAILCLVLALVAPAILIGCASTPTSESTGEYVDDAVITTKVKAQLAGDKLVSLLEIAVETYKGTVQLSGFVNTQEQKDEAEKVAREVKGVKDVKNSLIIKAK